MQRIRMSLPYFAENGWNADVVTVNEKHSDLSKDNLLLKNIPSNIIIHSVEALSKKFTSKFGLGSLGLRSMYFYKKYVDKLLNTKHYDLIYFSTTEFSLTILGAYWKKKYKVPYVVDMQDPWYSTYYQDKPTSERPPKYWFSNTLNKYLEPIAMKSVDGLISVSQAYIDDLRARYPKLESIPTQVITFGAFQPDFDFVKRNEHIFKLPYTQMNGYLDIIYLGRGGHDLKKALALLFEGFKKGLVQNPALFEKFRFHFIGTSYAPKKTGIPTVKPVADKMGVGKFVSEQTDRIPFYDGIFTLLKADALVVIGSDDAKYTASKIYPYILAEKPMMGIFHPASSATKIIDECNAGKTISILEKEKAEIEIYDELLKWAMHNSDLAVDWDKFSKYDANNMTKLQCKLFNQISN